MCYASTSAPAPALEEHLRRPRRLRRAGGTPWSLPVAVNASPCTPHVGCSLRQEAAQALLP